MSDTLSRPDAAAPARHSLHPAHPRGAARTRSWQHAYGRRLLTTDLLSIIIALVTARTVRFTDIWPDRAAVPDEVPPGPLTWFGQDHWAVSLILLVLWMGALSAAASRNRRIIGSGAVEYRRVAQATFAVFGLLAIIAFAAQWQISRGYLIIALPLGLGLLLITRWLWRRRLTVHSAAGLWDRRAVLAGEPTKVSHALEQIRRARPGAGLTVIDTDTQCTVASILDAVTASGADTVLLTSADALDPRTMRELGWELSALDVDVIAAHSLTDVGGPRLHSLPVAGLSLVQVDYPRLSGSAALTKRTFDIGFSLLALCALIPVLAVIAWAVRRDTPGGAIFRQERVGLKHTRFTMLKFRSMVVDAEAQKHMLLEQSEGNDVLFKMKADPRVTRTGRLLRRCSLDELPQFINVLRGDMSIVGPRPPLASEVDEYDDAGHRRLLVKPGITGLWQIQGRSDLSWEDSVRLDLYYVENWSLSSDIGIIFRTLRAVTVGAGAY